MHEISTHTNSAYSSISSSSNASRTSLQSTHSDKSKAKSTSLKKKNSGILSGFLPSPGSGQETIASQKNATSNFVVLEPVEDSDDEDEQTTEKSENPNISRNNFFSNPNTSQISSSSTHSSNSATPDDSYNINELQYLPTDEDFDQKTDLPDSVISSDEAVPHTPAKKKKKIFSKVRNVIGQIWGELTEKGERGFNRVKSFFKMPIWKNKQKSSKNSKDSISIHSDKSERQLTGQKEDDSNSITSSWPSVASSQTSTSPVQSGTTEATTFSAVWPSLDNKTDLLKKLAEQMGADGKFLLKSVKGGQPVLQISNAVEEDFSASIENVLEVGVPTKRRDTKAFSILNRGRPIKPRTSDNSLFLGQGLERGQTFSIPKTEKPPTQLKYVVGPKQRFLITNFYKQDSPSEEEKAKFEQKLISIAQEFPKFQEAYEILEIPITGDFGKIHDAYKAKKQKVENSSLSKADKDKELDEIAEAAGILRTGTHSYIGGSRTIL